MATEGAAGRYKGAGGEFKSNNFKYDGEYGHSGTGPAHYSAMSKSTSPYETRCCSNPTLAFIAFTIVSVALGVLASQGKLGFDIPATCGGPSLGLYIGLGLPIITTILVMVNRECEYRRLLNEHRSWAGGVSTAESPEAETEL